MSRNSIPCVKFMPRVLISVSPSFFSPSSRSKSFECTSLNLFFLSSSSSTISYTFTLLWIFSGNNIAVERKIFSRWGFFFRGLILFIACTSEKCVFNYSKVLLGRKILYRDIEKIGKLDAGIPVFNFWNKRRLVARYLFFMMARVLVSAIKISKLFFGFPFFFFFNNEIISKMETK